MFQAHCLRRQFCQKACLLIIFGQPSLWAGGNNQGKALAVIKNYCTILPVL
jgi:hypothetical protein